MIQVFYLTLYSNSCGATHPGHTAKPELVLIRVPMALCLLNGIGVPNNVLAIMTGNQNVGVTIVIHIKQSDIVG